MFMEPQPRIFCLWTDKNTMSEDCYIALSSIKNSGLEVIFVNTENLPYFFVENTRLHTAYNYLSSVYKADYLRCYLKHYHGGAYTNVKPIENSWLLPFEQLTKSDCFINGYREVGCVETARGRSLVKDLWLALNFYRVIRNGAYTCKPNTAFTRDWFSSVHNVLNCKFDILKSYPAKHPRGFSNKIFEDGLVSDYPLRWIEICGAIFHPFCLKYSKKLLKNLPTPDFTLKYL